MQGAVSMLRPECAAGGAFPIVFKVYGCPFMRYTLQWLGFPLAAISKCKIERIGWREGGLGFCRMDNSAILTMDD